MAGAGTTPPTSTWEAVAGLLASADPVLLGIIGRSLAVSACAGGAGFALGLLLAVVGQRLPLWAYHVTELCGSAVITLATTLAGGGADALAASFLFVLVIVEGFFFFTWPLACAHLVTVLAAVLLVVGHQPGSRQPPVRLVGRLIQVRPAGHPRLQHLCVCSMKHSSVSFTVAGNAHCLPGRWPAAPAIMRMSRS